MVLVLVMVMATGTGVRTDGSITDLNPRGRVGHQLLLHDVLRHPGDVETCIALTGDKELDAYTCETQHNTAR
jgi:hypothetical protein